MDRKKDAAVVGAYTGYLMGSFSDYHKYIEQLMGRPVMTHEIPFIAEEIKEKAEKDWEELLSRCMGEEREVILNPTNKGPFLGLAKKWASE